ncbi:MAG: NUDIX hydrolase [Dehalococcoidales bacterium]|nr:MAG: NUDIX hydrolase [Dehalococcoidales bacterium]
MTEEEVLSSEFIYEGRAFTVRVDTIKTADGRETTRDIIEHSECVAIVAIDPDDKILMVNQYRPPVGKQLLEIPAGGIDGDETPIDAVRREMQEETGYLPGRIEKLGGFYSAPGFCTEYLHLYLATELVPSRLIAEDTDSITLARISPGEITELIKSGEICDAKSIAGLLTWLDTRKSN